MSKFTKITFKIGIGYYRTQRIGNGGGGQQIHGGINNRVNNVIIYGINMKIKLKYLKNKENLLSFINKCFIFNNNEL